MAAVAATASPPCSFSVEGRERYKALVDRSLANLEASCNPHLSHICIRVMPAHVSLFFWGPHCFFALRIKFDFRCVLNCDMPFIRYDRHMHVQF